MDTRAISTSVDSSEIRKLAADFPYCATYQVMAAMADKAADSLDHKKSLQRAAIAIQDRSKLYTYILQARVGEQIDAFESDVEQELAKDSNEEIQSSLSLPDEINQADDSQPISLVLSSKPMEEEILREAIIHIGELETSDYLAQLDRAALSNPSEAADSDAESGVVSFGDWLIRLSDRKEAAKPNESLELIDKFISSAPQISPVKAAFFSPSQMGKLSIMDDESFVTETLARIYLRQGHGKKAARAFEILSLKYPEKTLYFAALKKEAEEQAQNT